MSSGVGRREGWREEGREGDLDLCVLLYSGEK